MKTIITSLLLLLCLKSFSQVTSSSSGYYDRYNISLIHDEYFPSIKNKQTETFKVWGNCRMCEKTIEKSLKIKGVSNSNWDRDTKMITVIFDSTIITLQSIHKTIASVGHDTELEMADDESYNNLNGCCQYERKNK